MSGSPSSYRTFESEDDENNDWITSSESSFDEEDDEHSDELTLLNGDEDSYEDSTTFEDFIKLSIHLKKLYNLREASVALERCDKIWDTMQLLKNVQGEYDEANDDSNSEDTDYEENGAELSSSAEISSSFKSLPSSVPYIKYQPTQGNGNNALPNFYLSVKSQRKVYNCPTCGKLFNEKRAFRAHAMRDHGIALSLPPSNSRKRLTTGTAEPRIVTRSKIPQGREANENYNENNEKDSRKSLSKNFKYPSRLSVDSTDWKISNYSVEDPLSGQNMLYRYRRRMGTAPTTYAYDYACMMCDEEFFYKAALTKHIHCEHSLAKSKYRRPRKFSSDDENPEKSNDEQSNTERSRKIDDNEEISLFRSTRRRAGPKSSKNPERPKRACAVDTSYSELAKNDEESQPREKFVDPDRRIKQSEKFGSAVARTIKCFLCKNSYVDMSRHLRDYHRIISPDGVLPLNEKLHRSETSESSEKPSAATNLIEKSSIREKIKISGCIDDRPYRKFYEIKKFGANRRKKYQCLVCMYNYADHSSLRRHLNKFLIDGTMRKHSAFVPHAQRRSKMKNSNAAATRDSPIMKNFIYPRRVDDNSRKREIIGSDESTSTCEASKRRKIVDSSIRENIDELFETTSESNAGESAIERSKNKSRYRVKNNEEDEEEEENEENEDDDDDEEDKKIGQRDTRDSSDRDSGIGISITIKKRNNSYEVVDKDNYCDEDKARNEENPEDDNSFVLTTETSTDARNSDPLSIDEIGLGVAKARGDEIFRNFDNCGARERNETSAMEDDDDIAIINLTDSSSATGNEFGDTLKSTNVGSEKASTNFTDSVLPGDT